MLKEKWMFFKRHTSVLACLICSTVLSSPLVAMADTTSDKKTSGVAAKHRPVKEKQKEKTASNVPSMLGATSPTDAVEDEKVEVHGHTHDRGDGDTGRAFGGGLMTPTDAPKSVSAVTRDYIAKQNPGMNPVQLIALLPGANVSDTDPLGMTGGDISVRGLTSSQMGFTLEGFPINDIGNFSVYAQEIADAENLKTVRLAQGSADLDSPHISATGGVVDMYMIDPKKKIGGHVDMTYGSYNATRGFARFDTGYIGNTNLRAYFSYSQGRQDHWRGPGMDDKKHGEMKIVNDWGDGNRVSLAVIGNSLNNSSYPTTSLASWKQWGTGFINPVGSSGIEKGQPANTVYDKNFFKGDNNYYKLRMNPFTNIYASMPSTFKLTDHLVLTETPYFWYGYGNGGGAYGTNMSQMPYGPTTLPGSINGQTTAGSPLLYNPSLTQTYRPGATTKMTWTAGPNRLMVGYWFEYSKQHQTSPYSMVGDDGRPESGLWGDNNNVVLSNGQTAQYRDTLTQTEVHTPFIGDSLSLFHDKLTIDAGLKYSIVRRRGTNNLPGLDQTGAQKYVNTNYNTALPTAAIRYKIDAHNQLFASVATNFRMPTNYALYDSGTYNKKTGRYGTQANPNQNPEISISEEAGWRYQDDLLSTSITYFHYNFTNRLFSQTLLNENGQTITTNINAGGSHSDGVDAEIGTRPIYHLRPYVSFEYLHAVTDSNILSTSTLNGAVISDYARTKGKVSPQSPSYMVAFGLDYDDGPRFIGFNLKYTAKQYSTFMNDEHIPGYLRMNIHMGYRFPKWGIFKSPTIRLNLQNLSNNRYLGYVSSPVVAANSSTGVNGGTITGKTAYYRVASPFAALATISSDF